jgi:hypothetical protein
MNLPLRFAQKLKTIRLYSGTGLKIALPSAMLFTISDPASLITFSSYELFGQSSKSHDKSLNIEIYPCSYRKWCTNDGKLSLSHPAPQNVLQLSLRDKGLLVYSAHRDIHHTFCRHHNRIPK